MKRKVKTMSIEDAIKEKFPDATIYEVRNDRFGKWILKYTIYKYIKYKISDTCNDQTDSQCL